MGWEVPMDWDVRAVDMLHVQNWLENLIIE